MNIVIILLSFVLVVSSLFLILLVLVQLPKKEAGLGQAFGSSTTDALFGPGSGNMLTKLTKWTAAVFFSLVILIWILQGHNVRARSIDPREKAKLSAADKAAFDPKPAPAAPAVPAGSAFTNKMTNAETPLPPTNPTPAPAAAPAPGAPPK